MLGALLAVVLVAQAGSAGPALDLAACLQEAMARHPELASARLGVELARKGLKGTWSGYLPRVEARVSEGYVWSGDDYRFQVGGGSLRIEGGGTDTHSMGLYLTQPLWDGGRYYLQPRRAEADILRSEAAVGARREDLASEVVRAFLDLHRALRVEAVLEDTLALSRAQLELAAERRRLGDASRVDISRAQVAVGEDRISLERQRAVAREARVRLAVAIGRQPWEPLEVLPFQGELPGQEEERSGALERHPRLEENQQQEVMARLDVELATADHWPRLTGSLSYTRQDPEFYKVYSRFDEIYNLSIGLNMSVPLFEGFATQTAIETAEVRAERVRAERQALQQELGAAAAQALVTIESLRVVHAIEVDNARAAEDSLALAEERYRLGEGTALEVRDAQLSVTRARLSQVQTEFDVLAARARYHHARGDLLATYLGEEQTR
jgi:outer membrane protein TolC